MYISTLMVTMNKIMIKCPSKEVYSHILLLNMKAIQPKKTGERQILTFVYTIASKDEKIIV